MSDSKYQDLNGIYSQQSRAISKQLKLLFQNNVTSHLIDIYNLEKGYFLAKENQPVQGIYIIIDGKVKIFNTELDKKTKIFRLASKGDIVGFSSLNAANYWSSAVVIEKVKTYFINIDNLNYILKNNNKLSFLFINALTLKLRIYEMRQRYVNLFPASERIIEVLLLITYKFGNTTINGTEITDCISRRDIASFANTSTEQAIRTISSLNSKEYISIEGKKIIIKNKEALINQLKQYCCPIKLEVESPCYLSLFY